MMLNVKNIKKMACSIGLHKLIEDTLNGKPWFKYKQGNTVIEILDSKYKRINKKSSIGVANTTAKAINANVNNGYKNVGDVVYVGFNQQGRGVVHILPTNAQLDLINSEDLKKTIELQKIVEKENREKEFKERAKESNEWFDLEKEENENWINEESIESLKFDNLEIPEQIINNKLQNTEKNTILSDEDIINSKEFEQYHINNPNTELKENLEYYKKCILGIN